MKKFNSIMASFTKTIDRLEKLVEDRSVKQASKKQKIEEIENNIHELAIEKRAAQEVVVKMKEIFQPK